jgi:hypothetical protein
MFIFNSVVFQSDSQVSALCYTHYYEKSFPPHLKLAKNILMLFEEWWEGVVAYPRETEERPPTGGDKLKI